MMVNVYQSSNLHLIQNVIGCIGKLIYNESHMLHRKADSCFMAVTGCHENKSLFAIESQ
jgi:hypothetical protein